MEVDVGPTTPAQVYYVRSDRDPNTVYLMAENACGYLECDCKAAQFCRDRPCKHCKAVARGEVRPATWKAAATLVPTPFKLTPPDLWGDGGAAIDRAVARVRDAA
jgi:hypothetical protein